MGAQNMKRRYEGTKNFPILDPNCQSNLRIVNYMLEDNRDSAVWKRAEEQGKADLLLEVLISTDSRDRWLISYAGALHHMFEQADCMVYAFILKEIDGKLMIGRGQEVELQMASGVLSLSAITNR